MKTTIDFPDQLLHQAKIIAAERQTTLRELVVRGLESSLKDKSDEIAERKQKRKMLLKALQANNTEPMVPLTRDEIYNR